MPAIARVGDSASHGGTLITGSPNVLTNGKSVCRLGDTYACPQHGNNPIVSASTNVNANDKGVARVGDATSCGATITSGSPDTFVD